MLAPNLQTLFLFICGYSIICIPSFIVSEGYIGTRLKSNLTKGEDVQLG